MKKKFKDEAEVLALIDRYKDEISKTVIRICDKGMLAERLRDTCEASRVPGIRDEIETMGVEIAWREGRLETLKEILAEIRTMELPFKEPIPEVEVKA